MTQPTVTPATATPTTLTTEVTFTRAELLDLLTTAALIGRDTHDKTVLDRGDMTHELLTWPTIRRALPALHG